MQAFLFPNNSIHVLLIQHNHVDFCILKYTMLCYYVMDNSESQYWIHQIQCC